MVSPEKNEIKEILDDPSLLLNGDRRALAQAITLIESSRDDHRDVALGIQAAHLYLTSEHYWSARHWVITAY